MADVKTITVDNVTYNIKDEVAREAMNEVVHVTGDETIGGEKTFTNVIQATPPAAGSDDFSVPTTAWARDELLGFDRMSNGIINNPSNIKYTLDNNGVFTLKAGSKVYVPDGNGGNIPAGETWYVASQTVPDNACFCYGGGKFVAITYNGYVKNSTDGINWTESVASLPCDEGGWEGVCYNGTVFVAISSIAKVSTSSDGINWTEPVASGLPARYRYSGLTYKPLRWSCMSFGNNLIVAAAKERTKIGVSQDGLNWSLAYESGADMSPVSSAYGDGRFLVLGQRGIIYSSVDGTSWSEFSRLDNTKSWCSLTYTGSRFIAISGDGCISTSVHGDTWTAPVSKIENTARYYLVYNGTSLFAYTPYGPVYKSDSVSTDNNFKAVTIQNDIAINASLGGTCYVFVNEAGTQAATWYNDGSWIYSGTTFPRGTGHGIMWYDTTNNTIKYTFDDGATWSDKHSFPVVKLYANSAGTRWDRIGDMFDGIVWIGSHVALLPGLKVSLPNGRNPDGTCKNIIQTINSVYVKDLYQRGNDWLYIWGDGTNISVDGWWVERTYINYNAKTPTANDWMLLWDERRNQFFISSNGAPYQPTTVAILGRFRRDANTQYMPVSYEIRRAYKPLDRFDLLQMLDLMYPVGSIYLEANNTGMCPLQSVMQGTKWELVSSGRALWGGNGSNATSTINAGLPNITGSLWVNSALRGVAGRGDQSTGCFYGDNLSNPGMDGGSQSNNGYSLQHLDASRSSGIYGRSSTVQPPAYVVNVWRRTQ